MYKKANVVILPTNEKANIFLSDDKTTISTMSVPTKSIGYGQHLYILSNEKPQEGDWFISSIDNSPCRLNKGTVTSDKNKIIATTDNLIIKHMFDENGVRTVDFDVEVAKIPQSFIEHFVSEYNEGNIITKVMVEYEVRKDFKDMNDALNGEAYKLKINSDNTINIKPIKDSWNKYEHIANLIKFRNDYEKFKKDCHFGPNDKEIEKWTNEWIEQNLKIFK